MSDDQSILGSCLCGAVRFEVRGRPPPVGMCHCSLCRKASRATLAVRKERFVWIAGEDQVRTFVRPSGWRATFCGACGCPAPHPTPDGAKVWVPAGALDEDPGPRVAGHIFVGSRASWDVIGDKGPQFDEFPEGGT